MRTRAQRRYFTELKKRRRAFVETLRGIPCSMRYTECDWCYFCGHVSRCPYLPNPRKEWGIITRQETRAADKEKSYKEYLAWRTSRSYM